MGAARFGRPERTRPLAAKSVFGAPARWEWYALAALIAAALALRLYAIERIPSILIHDEADNLVNVYQIINGRGPGVFGFDWKPQPAASVYVLSLSMRLGMSLTALRLPAVLFSVAALLPFFLLLRRAVAPPAALIATGLLATDVWYLHFSRSGWENVETCLFLTGAALCADDASRTGRVSAFAWTGFWSAMGAYGYFSGRAILPAAIVVFLLCLLRPAIPRRRLLGGMLITVLTALILFAPQIPQVAEKWDLFQRRTRTLLAPETAASEMVGALAHSFFTKTRQLFAAEIPIRGERTQRYLPVHSGAFARPTAGLLALGMAASLFWFSATWRWWIFFLVPFFMTEVLVIGRSLNGARGVMFVPVLYLFVGIGVHVLWTLGTRLQRHAAVALIAGAIALAVFTTHRYFAWIRTPGLLAALEPAIPVSQFDDWQRFQLDWTAKSDLFYTVDMWKERAAEQRIGRHDAAAR
jgi:hypothetical protein